MDAHIVTTRLDLKTHTSAEFAELAAHPLIGTEPVYLSDLKTLGFLRREGEAISRDILYPGVVSITQAQFTAMGLGASPTWPERGKLFYLDDYDNTLFRTRELWVGTGASTPPVRLSGNDEAVFLLWLDYHEVGDTPLADLIEAIHTSSNSSVVGFKREGSPPTYGLRQQMAAQLFSAESGVTSIPMMDGPEIWAALDLTPLKRLNSFLLKKTVFTNIRAANLLALTQFVVTDPYSTAEGSLAQVIFTNCPLLAEISLAGQPLLSTSTINEIFAALPDRTGKTAGTITVTGCTNLGSMDTSIATALNWDVVDS